MDSTSTQVEAPTTESGKPLRYNVLIEEENKSQYESKLSQVAELYQELKPEKPIKDAVELKRLWDQNLTALALQNESILSKNIRVLPTLITENLRENFNEESRHYHTMYHIRNLFQQMNEFLAYASSSEDQNVRLLNSDKCKFILFLSIWFHDAIYDPQAAEKGQNEQESANLFHKYFDLLGKDLKDYGSLINDKEIAEIDVTVDEIILATIEHQIPEGAKCSKYDQSIDLMRVFLDMDLSILGSAPDEYTDYCYRIRQEYKHVPDKSFLEGRTKVLKHLSGMTDEQEVLDPNEARQLYFSSWGQQQFQKNAVTNINNELQWLQQVQKIFQGGA